MASTVAPTENNHSSYGNNDHLQISSLNGLIPELQTNIFRHIPRPSDLKSLCRTSKRLYDVAVKELYHTVSLEIGTRSDLRLSAMLHPSNAGLKHIKNLRIQFTPQHIDISEADTSRVQTIVRMLIDFLPENILEDFEWSPWLAFDQETFISLLDRQKRLQWLTALRLDGVDAIEKLEAKASDHVYLYENCQKLAIYPDSVSTLELGQFLLSKMSTLTELIVHTNFAHGHVHYTTRELNDTPTGPGLVNRLMFRHLLPFDKITSPPFAHLRTLRLVDVGLRHCAETYGRFIDFTQIEALRIVKCSGADALFSLLCKSAYLPRKLRCLELQHNDNSDNDALTAVDDFLCLVEGIEDLYIDVTNVKSMPNIDGIIKHGKTLDVLLVHASENLTDELVWVSDDFQRLCSSVTKLRQLSCAWPASSILRTSSPSWDSYQFSISSLPRLVTLHISTFPSCKANLEKPIYSELLRWQSSKLFLHSPFTTSSLKLVAFGVSDKIPSRQDSNNQLIFLRSNLINADRKEESTAVPVSWALRQYIEPRSDVLDFELTRRPKMPIRDYASYMDEDEDDDMV
ncbi:hypothetical protein QM012_008083 [Aureobasidium pullulans]|uniref:F-box domain-containing protein n=1 Tax=Aureobasidium pullulans TaxID=5580 RepID=A0ABR0TM29_AURPU